MDDAWWRVPGASVDGHRGAVRACAAGAQASCSCGRPFLAQPDVAAACLALLLHLQAAVRDGARVTGGGDDADGLGGVRAPRRPPPSSGSGGVELDIA